MSGFSVTLCGNEVVRAASRIDPARATPMAREHLAELPQAIRRT
jgi:hypothetical protein